MIVYVAGLFAMGVAGFAIGGGWGAVALMISWSAVAIACRQLWTRRILAQPQSENIASPGLYTEIDEIFVSLADIAGQRGWDIDKRLEIARLACERPKAPTNELERLYDKGARSLLGKKSELGQDLPNQDGSTQ